MTRRVMMRIRSLLPSCMLICWHTLCPQILRDGHVGIWWHAEWVVVLQLIILMTSAGALSVAGTSMKPKQNSFLKPIWRIGSVLLCFRMTVQRCTKQCYVPNVLVASSKSGTMGLAATPTHSVKTTAAKANSNHGEPSGKQRHHNLQMQHRRRHVRPPAARTQARSPWSWAKQNLQVAVTSVAR